MDVIQYLKESPDKESVLIEVDGKNMLEAFLEKTGQVIESVLGR